MKLKDSLLFMTAGIIGVFLGYWLLHAADALIFKTLESGDLATWFAAFGTILTLGFLIKQHTQMREEQKKEKAERKAEESKQRKELSEERKKREEHEKKQQEMWDEQKDLVHLEKFERHKRLLNEMLDGLEPRLMVINHFYDRDGIYKACFPDNSYVSCNIKASKNSDLIQCIHDFGEILQLMDKPCLTLLEFREAYLDNYLEEQKDTKELLKKLYKLATKLFFSNQRDTSFNNIIDTSNHYFSIDSFNIKGLIDDINEVLLRLALFCNINYSKSATHHISNTRFKYHLFLNTEYQSYAFSHPGFQINRDDSYQLWHFFYSCYLLNGNYTQEDMRLRKTVKCKYPMLFSLTYQNNFDLSKPELLEILQGTRLYLNELIKLIDSDDRLSGNRIRDLIAKSGEYLSDIESK